MTRGCSGRQFSWVAFHQDVDWLKDFETGSQSLRLCATSLRE
jgi:hypothetical protein